MHLLPLVAGALLLGGMGGCSGKGRRDEVVPPTGMNTQSQIRRYVDKAVRRSSEGVILMPSKKADTLFDRTRLNEIAQSLRVPAALCFVNRAIETMKLGQQDGETTFLGVPEGQIRIRTRINPAGEVLRTEIVETGFQDESMYACLSKAIKAIRWTTNKSGVVQFIDVIYWVSLGYQAEDHSDEALLLLRKQQAIAAEKARGCLVNRVSAGRYQVQGLSLMDRDGRTLVNRVEPGVLPENVGECVAIVFRDIRMQPVKEAFVRPFTPRADFVVATDGTVNFTDERWLAVLKLEEEAMREARLAELAGDDPVTQVDEGEARPGPGTPRPSQVAGTSGASTPEATRADPAAGGQKLKLGGMRKKPPG
ncbi:hypothetical protein [Nannocystis sp.]|uniref:hypothetical protein n=1 Tax=Nannocystis sp. TaxID=1962667 RepID=UPI0024297770|nr:hypothetical protein [Nannocystis sp.]MBK7827807.1 hypothetical protein [Nannocystis sp.]MBK9753847.1 hypothetical protein [Nannocystis sp.]